MARRDKKNTRSGNNNNNFTPADAFLRLSVVDHEGNEHRLPKDVAIYLKHHITEQMIAATEANPERKFQLVGSIHIVDDTPKGDIKF